MKWVYHICALALYSVGLAAGVENIVVFVACVVAAGVLWGINISKVED